MNPIAIDERPGGHDTIAAVADALMVRIKDDDKLCSIYDHRARR